MQHRQPSLHGYDTGEDGRGPTHVETAIAVDSVWQPNERQLRAAHSESEHFVPEIFTIIPAASSRSLATDGPFQWGSNAAASW